MKGDINKRIKFTTKEKRGALVLLVVAAAFFVIPFLFHNSQVPVVIKLTEKEKEQLKVIQDNQVSYSKKKYAPSKNKKTTLRYQNERSDFQLVDFDPDTLTAKHWQELGLSSKQAEVLLNYKEQIGGFHNIDQLYKAFVLDSVKVNEWKPYLVFNRKAIKPTLELNSATQDQLVKLKGIGPKLSERIIKYRDGLGGFYTVNQLNEVFGIPPETISAITPLCFVNKDKIKQININTVDLEQLRSHLYIDYKTAQVILNYRDQHGPFSDVHEFKKIKALDDDFIKKITPYLNFTK